jgi:hypothetical protein
MRFNKFFSVMLLSILLGCIPAVYTYWAPSAEGGKLSSGDSGTIAANDHIEFSFHDVRIQVTGNGTGIGFQLRVSPERPVSFVSDEVQVYERQVQAIQKVHFQVYSIDSPTPTRLYVRPTDTLTGRFFVADIEFGGAERVEYRVRLPAIKIGEQVYEIPEIDFTKKKGFGVFGP